MRTPQKPPPIDKLLPSLKPEKLMKIFQTVHETTSEGHYMHWDDLRFRKPPEGLSLEDWWLGLKMRRQSNYRVIPVKDTSGNEFRFTVPDLVTDLLHQIDRGGGTAFPSRQRSEWRRFTARASGARRNCSALQSRVGDGFSPSSRALSLA